jgi:F-type H+-transporting ATPase subunit gamma
MAVSGKAIKTRIKSVKNTKKMTKAMEMVSAAKMRKSVGAALATRQFALLARELMHNLSAMQKKSVPLLEMRPVKKMLVVLIASNRGLCGSFNANVFKKAGQILKQKENVALHRMPGGKEVTPEKDVLVEVLGIGKKSASFAKRMELPLIAAFDNLSEKPSFLDVLSISKMVLDTYKKGDYDKVVVVYTHFRSALVQEVKVRQMLPVSEIDLEKMLDETAVLAKEKNELRSLENYVFEPDVMTVLTDVLPKLVEIQLYEAVLESAASEHSARMVSMKNASSAAGDMIDALTLEYNKARQAAITREISEIVGGAAALE